MVATISSYKKYWWVILVVVSILAVGVGIYFYLQYHNNQEILKNPTFAAQVEAQTLVGKVGQLMVLPANEQPTIATVSDATKLKGQPFFAKAENGFKVLIYPKAKEAILYDPGTNKIVEVGPINISQPTTAPSVSTKSNPVKIALYNGTTTVGLTSTIEKQMQGKIANFTIVEKANASKSTYTKTVVVDVGGKNAAVAAQIATFLKGEVGNLPQGEIKPANADILVILSK
ncbi:MAG TPA: LytR C-terminal domain-containing protein [Methylomirabilota bacterium]|nr:LytR C-terminal domain-containing protein [Methylomirabilota bacterium]